MTTPTHLLTLWYPAKKGMKKHIDGYGGNNGDKDTPVYSLTMGNSCVFDFWIPKKQSVQLDSGDAIIFGGPQRLMPHQVKKVICGSFPKKDARINLTFRTLSDFDQKDEDVYQTEEYTQKLATTLIIII